MDATKLQEYIRLTYEIGCLEGDVVKLKARKSLLESDLLEQFQADGINQVKAADGTVFLHRQLWASAAGGNHTALNLALRSNGLEALVEEKVNSHRLSAYVREEEKEGRELPASLKAAIKVSEVFQIRVRS